MEDNIELEIYQDYFLNLKYTSLRFQAAAINTFNNPPNLCQEPHLAADPNYADSEYVGDREISECQVTYRELTEKPVLYLLVNKEENGVYQFVAQEKAFTVQDYDDNPDQVILNIANATIAQNLLNQRQGLFLLVLSRHGLMLERKVDLNSAIANYRQQYAAFHHLIVKIIFVFLNIGVLRLSYERSEGSFERFVGLLIYFNITLFVGDLMLVYYVYLSNMSRILTVGASGCPVMRCVRFLSWWYFRSCAFFVIYSLVIALSPSLPAIVPNDDAPQLNYPNMFLVILANLWV